MDRRAGARHGRAADDSRALTFNLHLISTHADGLIVAIVAIAALVFAMLLSLALS